jgi:hypothetical protein
MPFTEPDSKARRRFGSAMKETDFVQLNIGRVPVILILHGGDVGADLVPVNLKGPLEMKVSA